MVAWLLYVLLQNVAHEATIARGTDLWEAYVERVTPLPDGNGVTLTLKSSGGEATGHTPGQAFVRFPVIPPSYTAALARAPRHLSDSIQGRVARIHVYIDERGTQVAAVETRPSNGGQDYRLDYLTSYFDLTVDPRARHECSLAAAVLAHHPEAMKQGDTIWVRDVIKNTLFFYERESQALDMIRRFGDVAMQDDIVKIQQIRRDHGDRIGLISLRPFVPKAPDDRFVGWWGGFPLTIYVDIGSTPTRLFSTARGPAAGAREPSNVVHDAIIAELTADVVRTIASEAPADGQERRTGSAPATPPSHRFFDATNMALIGTESSALLADGIVTQRALTQYPDVFHEADPIARPFVSRGWPGQIAGGALFVAADVGLRYLLHRKHHHRFERLLPLVLTVYGTAGAVHGARWIRRVDQARRSVSR